jgi:hypothetical protein
MKRDMSLVRKILNWAVDQPNGCLGGNPEFEGISDELIGYHVYLMDQAGLVQAAGATTLGSSSPHSILLEVTWAGHDFADAARDDVLWKKATISILKDGASFSFELLKEWLKMEAKQKLGLP